MQTLMKFECDCCVVIRMIAEMLNMKKGLFYKILS